MCKNRVRGMGRYTRALIGVAVAALLAAGMVGCGRPAAASAIHGIAHRSVTAHRSSGGTAGTDSPVTAETQPPEQQGPSAPQVQQPYRMLFVGASITAGIGASSTADSFPYVLGDEVQKMVGPVQETVVATPGAPARVAMRWPLPGGQDLVVVHMATNDFLQGTPPLEYQSELLTLLRRIRAGSPHATLVCLGVWGSPDQLNRDDEGTAPYNLADQADCRAEGGYFVPLQRFFGQRRLHDPMPLGASPELRSVLGVYDLRGRTVAFHPSDAGENAIAEAIYGVLERSNSLEPPDTGKSF